MFSCEYAQLHTYSYVCRVHIYHVILIFNVKEIKLIKLLKINYFDDFKMFCIVAI